MQKKLKNIILKLSVGLIEKNYSTFNELEIIDTLYQQLDVIGLFSDWPATTSFYANCMIQNHLNQN